jgi:hypothetical protein
VECLLNDEIVKDVEEISRGDSPDDIKEDRERPQ